MKKNRNVATHSQITPSTSGGDRVAKSTAVATQVAKQQAKTFTKRPPLKSIEEDMNVLPTKRSRSVINYAESEDEGLVKGWKVKSVKGDDDEFDAESIESVDSDEED
jgi:hypothetical protein